MSTTKTLAKGTAWGLLSVFFIKFSGWFYYIILARTVTEEEIGLFSLALGVINIIMLFSNLGLGSGAVIRFVPFYASQERFNHVRRVVSISITVGTVVSILCMLLIIMFASDLSGLFHQPGLIPIFQILAFHIIVYNIYTTGICFLQGRKLIRLSSEATALQGLFKLVITTSLIFTLSKAADSIALGYLLSFALTAVLIWKWVYREYKKIPGSIDSVNNRSLLREMIPFGLTMVTLASMFTINSQFDRIMLGVFLPPEINAQVNGIYFIIVSFGSLLSIFATSIGGIFYPVITEFWGKKETGEMQKTSAVCFRWIALSTIPFLLMILAFPREILTIIYGSAYEEGYIALSIYSLGLFIYAFSYPVQQTLSAMNRLHITFRIVGLGAAINIILNLVFIPLYSMNGAALASAISFSLMSVLFIRERRSTYLAIPRNFYKPIASGIITLIPLLVIGSLSGEFMSLLPQVGSDSLWGDIARKMMKVGFLGIVAGITLTFYVTSLIFFKTFTSEDGEIILGAMKRARMPESSRRFVERILIYGSADQDPMTQT